MAPLVLLVVTSNLETEIMQMDTEELTEAVMESHEAIHALTAGCQELARIMHGGWRA
jgi:hypothetical protein